MGENKLSDARLSVYLGDPLYTIRNGVGYASRGPIDADRLMGLEGRGIALRPDP